MFLIVWQPLSATRCRMAVRGPARCAVTRTNTNRRDHATTTTRRHEELPHLNRSRIHHDSKRSRGDSIPEPQPFAQAQTGAKQGTAGRTQILNHPPRHPLLPTTTAHTYAYKHAYRRDSAKPRPRGSSPHRQQHARQDTCMPAGTPGPSDWASAAPASTTNS